MTGAFYIILLNSAVRFFCVILFGVPHSRLSLCVESDAERCDSGGSCVVKHFLTVWCLHLEFGGVLEARALGSLHARTGVDMSFTIPYHVLRNTNYIAVLVVMLRPESAFLTLAASVAPRN